MPLADRDPGLDAGAVDADASTWSPCCDAERSASALASSSRCSGFRKLRARVPLRDLARPRCRGRCRAVRPPFRSAASNLRSGETLAAGSSRGRRGLGSCQRTPVPPISSSGHALVERARPRPGIEDARAASRARGRLPRSSPRARAATASRRGSPSGTSTPRRTRCRRPSGWVTVPSFSAWVSSGRTMSAWLGRIVVEHRDRDDEVGGLQRLAPAGAESG